MPTKYRFTIVSPDTERVEWVVDALSKEHAAVVTTELDDTLKQLDPETDVLLIDSVYDEDVIDALTQKDAKPEYEYQLGVVTDTHEGEDFDADAIIPSSLSASGIRERVD